MSWMPVSDRTRQHLSVLGRELGVGRLISCSRLEGHTFHSFYRCEYLEAVCGVKQLVKRPDLPRWRERFEAAFAVESWLAARHSFLPRPMGGKNGNGVIDVQGGQSEYDLGVWFIAHQWIDGRPPDAGTASPDILRQIGEVIASVARAPLCLFSHRTGMDDEVPTTTELIELGAPLCNTSAVLRRQLKEIGAQTAALDEICHSVASSSNVVTGHRDLSPKNTLIADGGELGVVDWENAGPVVLEGEIGRAMVLWCIPEIRDMVIKVGALLSGLEKISDLIGYPDETWFAPWLRGHLMFLRYLLVSAYKLDSKNQRLTRIEQEIATLAAFAQQRAALLDAIRASKSVLVRRGSG